GTPALTRASLIAVARSSAIFLFAAGSPTLSVWPSIFSFAVLKAFRIVVRLVMAVDDSADNLVVVPSKSRLSATKLFGFDAPAPSVRSLTMAWRYEFSGTSSLIPPGRERETL